MPPTGTDKNRRPGTGQSKIRRSLIRRMKNKAARHSSGEKQRSMAKNMLSIALLMVFTPSKPLLNKRKRFRSITERLRQYKTLMSYLPKT